MSGKALAAIALIILWLLLWQDVSAGSVVLGAIIAIAVLALGSRADAKKGGAHRLRAIFSYLYHLLADLVASSFNIAWDVVTPTSRSTPRVVRVPLRLRSDTAITALASSITLTPGSLTIEVEESEEGAALLVHMLYSDDDASAIAEIQRLEDRLLACLGDRGERVSTPAPEAQL